VTLWDPGQIPSKILASFLLDRQTLEDPFFPYRVVGCTGFEDGEGGGLQPAARDLVPMGRALLLNFSGTSSLSLLPVQELLEEEPRKVFLSVEYALLVREGPPAFEPAQSQARGELYRCPPCATKCLMCNRISRCLLGATKGVSCSYCLCLHLQRVLHPCLCLMSSYCLRIEAPPVGR
jgi:hypothetical protein